MSYSFNIRAETLDDAETQIRNELTKVAQSQPVHEADMDAAYDVAVNYLRLLAADPMMDLAVSVAGYLSWTPGTSDRITTASINVTASLAEKVRA